MWRRPEAKAEAFVLVVEPAGVRSRSDQLATEEPLEIRLRAGPTADAGMPSGESRSVAITMRTPGADFELAVGFLYGEGLIRDRAEVRDIRHCVDLDVPEERRCNIVHVELRRRSLPDLRTLQRHSYTSSACGVCGKTSLDALRLTAPVPISSGPRLEARVLRGLPEALRSGQSLFAATGGLHAAALVDAEGTLVAIREDVGRHNAVDKVVGWSLLEGRLPLSDHILMVSGRTSYEILQKAVMAGVPVVCAVSAPSTLAVAVAREFGITLVGFLRGDRFNVYAGPERLDAAVRAEAGS